MMLWAHTNRDIETMLFQGQPIDGVKFLQQDGMGYHSCWKYPLRKNGTTIWLPKRKVMLCKQGYHFATPNNILGWVDDRAFAVEAREIIDFGDKSAASSIRLVGELNWSLDIARDFSRSVAQCWKCLSDKPNCAEVANNIEDWIKGATTACAPVMVRAVTRIGIGAEARIAQSHLLMSYLLNDTDAMSDAMEALTSAILKTWSY